MAISCTNLVRPAVEGHVATARCGRPATHRTGTAPRCRSCHTDDSAVIHGGPRDPAVLAAIPHPTLEVL